MILSDSENVRLDGRGFNDLKKITLKTSRLLLHSSPSLLDYYFDIVEM
jgi:hypothetical protein